MKGIFVPIRVETPTHRFYRDNITCKTLMGRTGNLIVNVKLANSFYTVLHSLRNVRVKVLTKNCNESFQSKREHMVVLAVLQNILWIALARLSPTVEMRDRIHAM